MLAAAGASSFAFLHAQLKWGLGVASALMQGFQAGLAGVGATQHSSGRRQADCSVTQRV